MKACHISSVHPANDPRIRLKQIDSLANNGFDITFITGDTDAKESDTITIKRVSPGRKKRLTRMLLTSPKVIWAAFKEKPDIYHFHDPELLPWAWLLLLTRKPIIYDIHEDYYTSVSQKSYLPVWARFVLAFLTYFFEKLLSYPFTHVIAEKYYSERFPRAHEILNYPQTQKLQKKLAHNPESTRLLYTGTISTDRGALIMAELVRQIPDYSITAVGRCPQDLAKEIRMKAGGGSFRFHLPAEGRYVPFDEIVTYYSEEWLAGLALFPDTHHYRQKQLTKFFEYMAVGLPIIASDFPVWRRFIVEQGIGICVSPNDIKSIADALSWLRDHPEKAKSMGARGKSLAQELYNWSSQERALVKLYNSLLT
ncbi:glycosyltransferase involved in cell wall biosynthesis [Halospina denitrificans]|uniref:Glycosyltransferase involved in cell wall biosynthesis n=1 Tax=Halospina denitrificans TaxID=332522 RepID=A0A4R7JY86_9GAMM|nr:glycosyltransferase [Halospina denitrificans]TDT43470.1 glycosyltransferase involved in cell wall biosynthesis [Halospina denitrificans]